MEQGSIGVWLSWLGWLDAFKQGSFGSLLSCFDMLHVFKSSVENMLVQKQLFVRVSSCKGFGQSINEIDKYFNSLDKVKLKLLANQR